MSVFNLYEKSIYIWLTSIDSILLFLDFQTYLKNISP